MRKSNFFIKSLKNINKSINNQLEQNLNKLKFENLVNLTKNNKIFLSFVALILLFLSYISLPNIYNKSNISNELQAQLLNKYNLKLNISQNIKYNFFPIPNFSFNNSSIIIGSEKDSKIRKVKIYISIKNLFPLKNIKIKKIVFEEANFYINSQNYDFFIKILENNFESSTLKIQNSNIFFRDNKKEVLFINNISNMRYYYDQNHIKNILYCENKIFNLPYFLEITHNKEEKKLFTKLNLDFLRFQLINEHNYKDNIKKGTSDIIFNNLKSSLSYSNTKKLFEFYFFEKSSNPEFKYEGKINFKPFYANFNGVTDGINLAYFFDSSALIVQLLKTEIFNNKNINFELRINAKKIKNFSNFKNILFNSKIKEGLLDIDSTNLNWKNNAFFELANTLVYIKDGELILDGSSQIKIADHNEIYKFLLTPKKFRKKIEKVKFSYTYNFDQKIINFKDILIDGKFNKKVNKSIKEMSIKNDSFKNKIYLKKFLNEVIKNYSG